MRRGAELRTRARPQMAGVLAGSQGLRRRSCRPSLDRSGLNLKRAGASAIVKRPSGWLPQNATVISRSPSVSACSTVAASDPGDGPAGSVAVGPAAVTSSATQPICLAAGRVVSLPSSSYQRSGRSGDHETAPTIDKQRSRAGASARFVPRRRQARACPELAHCTGGGAGCSGCWTSMPPACACSTLFQLD